MTKVLIVGTGAIGGFYGSLLARQGIEVSVVCRSEYEHVKQHGFQINSHHLGDWIFKPARVLKRVSDYQEEANYVFLCSKLTAGLNRVDLIREAVTKNTSVVFIQNGVEIEQEMIDAFPDNEVVSGLAFICCNRIRTGVISHLAYGRLALGNLPKGISEKTLKLCELFNRSGIDCQPTENIVTARWQKCIWNAPFNPLSVLSGGLYTKDILDTQESLVRNIMNEVFNIAAATGHPLPEDVIDINIQNTYAMPPYKTSMLLDFEAGRPMETEAILGNIVRAARRVSVDCTYLESLYALMKLRELTLTTVTK